MGCRCAWWHRSADVTGPDGRSHQLTPVKLSAAPDLCSEYNGGCHQNADCNQTGQLVNCTCHAGYHGDGFSCQPINRWAWPSIFVSIAFLCVALMAWCDLVCLCLGVSRRWTGAAATSPPASSPVRWVKTSPFFTGCVLGLKVKGPACRFSSRCGILFSSKLYFLLIITQNNPLSPCLQREGDITPCCTEMSLLKYIMVKPKNTSAFPPATIDGVSGPPCYRSRDILPHKSQLREKKTR